MPSTPISSIAWCKPAGSPLALEYGAMSFPADSFPVWEARFASAFAAMKALEAGAVANPDEGRMVGHYWLRAPELAPKAELAQAIRDDVNGVRAFAAKVHSGEIAPPSGGRFRHLLVIGIGGSALGPQLVADALAPREGNKLEPHFLDNTDPEGIARVLHRLGKELAATLAIVISKSGGTPETRNGMLLAAEAYEQAGLAFAKHAVAVTGSGSQLDKHAKTDGFLARFPMYDWVGGRTSVMSCVGLLPAALQGIDIDAFLRGAAEMDAITRKESLRDNPAALLAMLWHHATNGRGERDMVVLPYCDRLLLFSRYLQQLVMESLGKELDLAGKVVHQGIAVYGNKGSTDQHAYVQQLREGVNNFFAVFVEVLRKGGSATEVEPGATAGDFLNGFLLGTRKALRDNGRPSLTISVETIEERTLGALIALFERAVGFYATLVNINAYHQPGVEAGKKAAAAVLALQERLLRAMKAAPGVAKPAAQWVGEGDAESAFFTLRHLAYSGRPVRMEGDGPDATFSWQGNA